MERYLSVKERGESELEERRSRFLGFVSPVECEEDARAFIDEVIAKHPTAKHHVYAYIVRQNSTVRYTDDGEPQGTAGIPVLTILQKQNLFDCAAVVVRYFGGVLLGTGGLIRAYGEAVSLALKKAGIVCVDLFCTISCRVSYADYQKTLPFFNTFDGMIDKTEFGEEVEVVFSVSSSEADNCIASLTDLTGARAVLQKRETQYRKIEINK